MPRAPKPPGQAVDQRNGAKLALPGVALEPFGLPGRSDRRKYHPRVLAMWEALWADERLAAALSPVDRELLVRWAQAVDDSIKALAAAWADPISTGSMKQEVESPYFGIAAKATAVAEKCEAQIGIGALNRARLGIALLTEAKSLADLSAAFDGGGGNERDPRLG